MEHESVYLLFKQIADKHGSCICVDQGQKKITYGELKARVGRLINLLRSLEVKPGAVIAVVSADPIEVITGILATLGVRGIFCPIDPYFPEKRLQAMIQVASPTWFITELKFAGELERVIERTVPDGKLIVDGLPGERDCHRIIQMNSKIPFEGDLPDVQADPEEGCSIYFTSGTTGRAKGILGRLKGIDHFVRWEIEVLGVKEGTRVSQLASPGFDGFLKDVFAPLCAGGVVCAPEKRGLVQEAGRLIDWVDVEGVEVLHCVPSVMRAMLNEKLEGKYFPELKWVVLAGEAVAPVDVRRWREIFGDRIGLVNLYGATETTITKLYHFIRGEDVERPSIPIGKPMPGAAAMILNAKGKLCQPGAVGEICIRTPYRALGYYGEPEMTREVFIANPFSPDASDIIYKTGDYGRLLKDGNLEFLGRRDQQVKVRGVRVELVEVEKVLRGHASVKDVAVVDREDRSGNKYLCAYVVVKEGSSGVKGLREYAGQELAEYMVPSGYVEMAELPRTLNGKIDRKSLPELEEARGERGEGEKERRRGGGSPVREMVRGIWEEVLRLRGVGEEENFFEMGGHSLLATQIISRVREGLGVELPLRAVFEAPTIGEMAERVERELGMGYGSGEGRDGGRIERAERGMEAPLSYAQQRMWVLEELTGGETAFNIALGLRVRGGLNVSGLEQTMTEVVRRHEILRTRFPELGGEPVQLVEEAVRMRLPVVDLSGLGREEREEAAQELGNEEGERRFDLRRRPAVRSVLLRLGEGEHVVLCTMHHLVADAWSFEVLRGEMSQLYGSYGKGEPSGLEELEIQYGDYAVWERKWLSGAVLEERREYWRKKLKGAPVGLKLPQSRPRPAVQSFRGGRERVELGEELVERLRELSRGEGATLYMTLLSGFLVLLNQYTGEEDLVVGSVIANRERKEVERLIGFLANTLVVRVGLWGEPSLRELLRRVRESCLGAYGQQLPPEKLAGALEGERGTGGQPLFEVWFQMESAGREKLELGGLEWERFAIERRNTRFELSLVLEESDRGIHGEMEYDSSVFDQETIEQMIRDYVVILEEMTADCDQTF
jgi:amino acid adenylation domain-containing protein